MPTKIRTEQILANNPPQGFLLNGKIVPSVTSNNLTVAIKGMDGNDPSASNPIVVRIGDTVRKITAALSVTRNAGTNWGNAGGAELATKEIDYAVYIGYNVASGYVGMGFSRIFHARTYADFDQSGSTVPKVFQRSDGADYASTDSFEVIGRFAATLSAGAGYTWSVPTFTSTNLVQRPIYESRWLTWYATLSTPTVTWTRTGGGQDVERYKVNGNLVHFTFALNGTTGAGSAASNLTFTTPVASLRGSQEVAFSSWGYYGNFLVTMAHFSSATTIRVLQHNAATFAAGSNAQAFVSGTYEI